MHINLSFSILYSWRCGTIWKCLNFSGLHNILLFRTYFDFFMDMSTACTFEKHYIHHYNSSCDTVHVWYLLSYSLLLSTNIINIAWFGSIQSIYIQKHWKHICYVGWLVGWLVVFNVPSTARSFRDGTPIYCPLRRTWSSINAPFPSGIEPQAVA